jgi:hypothetical protein
VVNFSQDARSVSCIEDTYIPSGSAAIKATAQVTSESGPQVGSVFRFREICKIAHLTKDGDNERNSGQSENARSYGNWFFDTFIEKPCYMTLISILFGALCSAVGIAINLNSSKTAGAILGGALVVAGILTPLFPWWILIFLVI